MAEHLSEEQQVEALKRLWREHGRSVTTGLILGFALILGWNLYQNHLQNRRLQASTLYTELLLEPPNASTLEEAVPIAEQLISQFGDFKIYATYGRYFLARYKREQGRFQEALKQLEAVSDVAPSAAYLHIARLRQARLLIAQKEPQKALALLQVAELPRAFAGLYAEVRGDAYFALGDREKAKAAYEEAWQLGLRHPFLQLKLEASGSALLDEA